jgi:hypothetical protein
MKSRFAIAAFAALTSLTSVATAAELFSENFDDAAPLNIPVDEHGRAGGVWDTTPTWTTNPTSGLAGWTFSKNITTNNPGEGTDEWTGWSFAIKEFWSQVAGDQQRSQFTLASGNVAVADPDEFDDNPSGCILNGGYNVFMTTPAISLTGVAANSATASFASSWRPEGFDDDDLTNNQTGKIEASFDGGATWTTVLHWDSDNFGPHFKPDATNENVTINLNNPSSAASVMLRFGLTNSNNDWWWAIDNLKVEGTVTTQTLAPTAYTIVEGMNFGGNLASLAASDDDKVFILNDEASTNARIDISATGANTPTGIVSVKYETSSSRDDLSVFMDVYDNGAVNNWVNRDFHVSTLTDTVRSINLPNGTTPVAGGLIKMSLRYLPQTDLEAADGWTETIDQVQYTIN